MAPLGLPRVGLVPELEPPAEPVPPLAPELPLTAPLPLPLAELVEDPHWSNVAPRMIAVGDSRTVAPNRGCLIVITGGVKVRVEYRRRPMLARDCSRLLEAHR